MGVIATSSAEYASDILTDVSGWSEILDDGDTTVQKALDSIDELDARLKSLATAEIQQLENIGVVTVSAAQWGYLGAMDQGVGTGDSVEFASITDGAATLTEGAISNTIIDGGSA